MINEEEFVAYFENIAVQSKALNHTEEKNKSFFYVENAVDLDEFDEALRNASHSQVMILVAENGTFSDNSSSNNTHTLEAQIMIIGKKKSGMTIRKIRSNALTIALDIIERIKKDCRGKMFPDKKFRVTFKSDSINYDKVGPINHEWYGYALELTFTCPFTPSVNSGTWRDIDNPPPPVMGGAGSLSADLA